MSAYETRLAGSEEIASGTMAFHFEKPEGFEFKAGQAMDVILPAGAGIDAQNDTHTFSIVNAPCEHRLTIATRMRDSPYKRALKALATGTPLHIEGPFGAMTLHNKQERAAVFIAGGIGITPFLSMLRHAANAHLSQQLVLVYSNRRPEDTAFLAELLALEGEMENFRLVATMTHLEQSTQPWPGQTGAIDAELLRRVAEGLPEPVFYVAGPPPMVEAMRDLLNEIGIDDDDIRSEDFYGY
ncbi:MAG: ferredoxin--NADP reductase [Betaproteobacteria bacterium]